MRVYPAENKGAKRNHKCILLYAIPKLWSHWVVVGPVEAYLSHNTCEQRTNGQTTTRQEGGVEHLKRW